MTSQQDHMEWPDRDPGTEDGQTRLLTDAFGHVCALRASVDAETGITVWFDGLGDGFTHGSVVRYGPLTDPGSWPEDDPGTEDGQLRVISLGGDDTPQAAMAVMNDVIGRGWGHPRHGLVLPEQIARYGPVVRRSAERGERP